MMLGASYTVMAVKAANEGLQFYLFFIHVQGGVLIFYTRAVTWGLGFSCLVQCSVCVVVKAIYLLLFICLVPVWWSKLYIYYYLSV